jgi:6-phosphogluconate dehydrogenase (decarboxylating)
MVPFGSAATIEGIGCYTQAVFNSSDGVNWTLVTTKSGAIPIGTSVKTFSHDNKMWVMVPFGSAATIEGIGCYTQAVFNSSDGVNWTLVTTKSGAIPVGTSVKTFSHDNKMWVMVPFGSAATIEDIGCYTQAVFNSSDGVNWTLVTTKSGAIPHGDFIKTFTCENKMWVMVPFGSAATIEGIGCYTQAVFNSSDGVNWTLVTTKSGAIPIGTSVKTFSHDNKMWVMVPFGSAATIEDIGCYTQAVFISGQFQ